MARSIVAVILVACIAFTSTAALQVSPNSQCSSVCQDGIDQDKSNPKLSNTVGEDVICHDSNYATPVGQKFKKCLECLHESSDKSSSESDLQWFLYNLRFAVTSCVFGLANATDPISSPCTIQSSCGPLVGALQDGLADPTSENRFGYCSAFGASFLGPRYAPCTRCLQLTDEQKYMSNFMVALKAGCTQKPEPGKIINLAGSIFSKDAINATTDNQVVIAPTTPVEQNRGGLTTGAYAGIGVAGAAIVIILAVVCYIGWRKKQDREKRDEIASRLDEQFGNGRITGPVPGAFGDPYASQGSPYQNVGMTTVRSEKPYGTSRGQSRQHEEYYPEPQYQRPLSTYSQHQQQGVREVGAPIPYANYNPSRVESPTPAYSPSLSAHLETPGNSPSSTTRLHHAVTANESSTPTRSQLGPAAGESAVKTRPTISVSTTDLLPGPPPPQGAPRPAQHTRDLSVGRDTYDRSSNSGPQKTVSTRFDVDDESKKKAERQRLYQLGFNNK